MATKKTLKTKRKVPPITVLFENTDYIVVNKPSGLIVHPDGKTKEPALTDWIFKKYPKLKNVGEPIVLNNELRIKNHESVKENSSSSHRNSQFSIHNSATIPRPGIVHRIDRETSGALVIAKNQRAYVRLKKQFKRHDVRKIYHAFVYGTLPDKEGRITKPITRSTSDFRRFTSERGGRGEAREALTYYRVLKVSHNISFIEVRPHTGRTHQIRVHFRAIGHPVVSDELYASHFKKALGFGRLALHARTIEFTDLAGKRVSVTAPYPTDFVKALKVFEVKIA